MKRHVRVVKSNLFLSLVVRFQGETFNSWLAGQLRRPIVCGGLAAWDASRVYLLACRIAARPISALGIEPHGTAPYLVAVVCMNTAAASMISPRSAQVVVRDPRCTVDDGGGA